MHLQFPLAQPVRHRRIAPPDFAARAKRILGARDDCLMNASVGGPALLARNEGALAAPRQVLQQVFGVDVEFEPVRVRVALLEEDSVRTRAILRGEGQAARLLGLGDELFAAGGRSILLWMALSRYVPEEEEEDGAGDGNRTHV